MNRRTGLGVALCLIVIAVLVGGQARTRTTQEVWAGLVQKSSVDDPAFAWVAGDPALPSVLLYGDSVSMLYTPAVREGLAGRANVFRLHINGGASSHFVERFDRLESAMRNPRLVDPWTHPWSVIHFNVGLHDLKYVKDGKLDREGQRFTTPEQYEANLRTILAHLQARWPDATLVFATTTPIPTDALGRVPGDEVAYNAIALRVLAEHPDVVVNDLYGLTVAHVEQWSFADTTNVHPNRVGQAAQGAATAELIAGLLDVAKPSPSLADSPVEPIRPEP
jgi:hypothetical protein